MTQQMEEPRLDKVYENDEKNLYESMIINDFDKVYIRVNTSQTVKISNSINYVQYNRNPVNCHKLYIKASEPKCHKKIL